MQGDKTYDQSYKHRDSQTNWQTQSYMRGDRRYKKRYNEQEAKILRDEDLPKEGISARHSDFWKQN